MKEIKWFIDRLKAMGPQEVLWRIQQKGLQKKEKNTIYSLHKPVTEIPLPQNLSGLHIDIDRLSINWENNEWTAFTALDLFGTICYGQYKDKWNAGFQTGNTWPEEPFSPTINISQRADIGDIRTSWELSRHFQFAALAKSYYCTKEEGYLEELKGLFSDWNNHNLFLHGVAWISAMELAIRVNSWVYAFAFLKKAGCGEKLLCSIEQGVLVMVNYITKHHARFSSANNHLIVEMYAVALVGILTGYAPWRDRALEMLTDELPRQNYPDGVNKEMSLHYQSFVMEAYGLLWLLLIKNHIEVPEAWKTNLASMAGFVADSTDGFGATIEFGDSDEGKILDINGKIENHYQYVLNLMGCLLGKKYTHSGWHENLDWIVPKKLRVKKEYYLPGLLCSRKEGGYTFIRSKDRRVLIGIDHAELGFGSIAAHGHGDALSFQMNIGGQPVFVDSGTYSYHATPEDRNYFRSTAAHNTVVIGGQGQSEMLGSFLWGKRAKAELVELKQTEEEIILAVKCEGEYGTHVRIFWFNYKDEFRIQDYIGDNNGIAYFHINPALRVGIKGNDTMIYFGNRQVAIENKQLSVEKTDTWYSPKYGTKIKGKCLAMPFRGTAETVIKIKRRDKHGTGSEAQESK